MRPTIWQVLQVLRELQVRERRSITRREIAEACGAGRDVEYISMLLSTLKRNGMVECIRPGWWAKRIA